MIINSLVLSGSFLSATTDCVANGISMSAVTDILSVAFSFFALITSISANITAKKSRKETKHLGLMDKRVSVMSEITSQGKTDESMLPLLFDAPIVEAYHDYHLAVMEKESIAHDIHVYQNTVRFPDGEGGFTSPIAEIMHFEQQLEQFDYPLQRMIEFRELCKKYEITYSETGNPNDSKVYNYEELSNKLGRLTTKANEKKTLVLNLMQNFIKELLSPNEK